MKAQNERWTRAGNSRWVRAGASYALLLEMNANSKRHVSIGPQYVQQEPKASESVNDRTRTSISQSSRGHGNDRDIPIRRCYPVSYTSTCLADYLFEKR